jgi:hypothetical protein
MCRDPFLLGRSQKSGLLIGTNAGRRSRTKGGITPLKIPQSILEDLGLLMENVLRSNNKKVPGLGEQPPTILKRGPTLNRITAEEEREIFQDKTDPPIN